MGNAHRLALYSRGKACFVQDWGGWHAWDGRRWKRAKLGEERESAKSAVRATRRLALENGSERLADYAEKSQSRARLDSMIKLAESEPGIPQSPEHFDNAPLQLNLANGLLDLETSELLEHNPNVYVTRLADVAFSENAECPHWVSFLSKVFDGNLNIIQFVQRAVGYTLTGTTGEQVLFFLYGTGANGKSTFLEIISALIGDYATQAPFTTFTTKRQGASNDLAMLAGARMVIATEADRGARFSESLLKSVTGQDAISARFLFREYFKFKAQFKLWIAANHKPIIKGQDEAIWRRIRIIPFTVTIPEAERDPQLYSKLHAELPGILQWALEGYRDWNEGGLQAPPEVLKATEEYREEMDLLADFLADCCVMSPSARIGVHVLFDAYVNWCEQNGEDPVKKRTFSPMLVERKFKKGRSGSNGNIRWEGIELRSNAGGARTEVAEGEGPDPLSQSSSYIKRNSKSSSAQFSNPFTGDTDALPEGYEEGQV